MHRLGLALLAIGALLLAINLALWMAGMNASYNLGDASKFEFRLLALWHAGAALVAMGAVLWLAARRR